MRIDALYLRFVFDVSPSLSYRRTVIIRKRNAFHQLHILKRIESDIDWKVFFLENNLRSFPNVFLIISDTLGSDN